MDFLEKLLLEYLKKHPEVIENLLDALVKRLIDRLKA